VKLGGTRAERAWLPVVGVTREVELDYRPRPDILPEPTLFVSEPDPSSRNWSIVVRPAGDPAALALRMSTMMRAALPVRAGTEVKPWLAAYAQQLQLRRFANRIFGGLGLVSLLLGAAGLFGVLTYAVGQRTREFGVRVALGAAPRDVLWLVMRSGLELTLGGIAIGTVVSVWIASVIGGFLYGVKPNDPVSLVGTVLLLSVVTVLAALVPAGRAMRVDPVEVLRAT
jgi:ABC-type lipoprotein release transport system permease subunit